MRQAGLCAAGCIHALDHHVERLADDHANARKLADALSEMSGVSVQTPETNLVYFDPADAGISAQDLVAKLRHQGIHLSMLAGRIRACTYLNVDAAMIDETVDVIGSIIRGR